MTAAPSWRVCHTSRCYLSIGLLCLCLLLLAVLPHSPPRAEEGKPETTITRLEFRVAGVPPSAGPVKSFRYSYELYSAGQEKPLQRLNVAYRAEDGVLRIPKPFPPFGRIRVWVHADDLKTGYRHGYGSFSYRMEAQKPAEPPVIQLEPGIVLTGRVLDAETNKPVAGAEVAPLKWGHHGSWADWDESVKTDRDGEYRVVTSDAEGIAARHPGYREEELDDRPWGFRAGHNRTAARWTEKGQEKEQEVGADGFVLRLQPLMALRGRVVDTDAKPIAGASSGGRERSESDAEGRFLVKVTRQEWKEREKGKISLYALNHRSLAVPLKDFSLDRELVVTLQPEPWIRGQVLGEDGKPLEDCKIELKCESELVLSRFDSIPGPHKQGKWKSHIGQYDRVFTLRVSVAGTVRSLKQYTLKEVTRGPIITKLPDGRRLTGTLVARVPLDEKSTPAVLLRSAEGEGLWRQARVQPDGSFAFFGLADGKYTLRLHPAPCARHCGGHMNPGVGAFTTFGVESPNKPWQKSITVRGGDVRLDPINLHDAGLLPGRVRGTAYHPDAPHKPFANGFGYICAGQHDFDSVGGSYYLLQFMTDADGRFRVDHCPPGKYVLRLTDDACGYTVGSPSLWIRVTPEKTLDLRPFAPGTDSRLTIDFIVGDGSPRDVHAGAGLDAGLIAKHTDPKTGELPYLDDESQRLRVEPSEITCDLQPLDESITHWPIHAEAFDFSAGNLLKANPRDIVIPNVSPGRWRLTLTAAHGSVFSAGETLLTRDFVFARGMAPLKIELPAAALAGTLDNPVPGLSADVTMEAIPRKPGLRARTCRGKTAFRFIGLAPGEYSLRLRAKGRQEKRVDNVLVQQGRTIWLDKIVLRRETPKTSAAPEKTKPGNSPRNP